MRDLTTRSTVPQLSTTATSPPHSDMMEPPLSTAPTLNQREQIRLEFYRTYDVMTGVRIAATLGGFFGMMVLLVVYKSRCRYGKSAISDVQLAAAAAAVEEEEQQVHSQGSREVGKHTVMFITDYGLVKLYIDTSEIMSGCAWTSPDMFELVESCKKSQELI